jgi:hypothetical protein
LKRLIPASLRSRDGTALKDAERLEAVGRALDAIDVLTEANRPEPSEEIERRLVKLRHDAFGQLKPSPRPSPSPPAAGRNVALDEHGIPTVPARALTAEALRGAILGNGCLLVRGLVPEGRVERLVEGIDRVFDGRDAHARGAAVADTSPWFEPFEPGPEQGFVLGAGRKFVNRGSGTWIADSPRLLFELLETFEEAGLRGPITEYLGERPALSVNKGTLRRVFPTGGTEWWHQDGAFLGEGIRALNLWLSLSHCGRDAPGLDVVPRRIEHIVEVGTRDADFDWSVASDVVEAESGGTIVRPTFRPGDALFFDHLFLHRTGTDPGMSRTRYATETWFFAPSAYPDPGKQIPLVF